MRRETVTGTQPLYESPFERAFRELILIEGGYGNNPKDRGGETKYGITKATARAAGYLGPMEALDLATARDIYRIRYWNLNRLDNVSLVSLAIAREIFECGVLMGPSISAQFLQIGLNALNREGEDYPDILIDGVIGPATLAALRAFTVKRKGEGLTVLLRALNSQQGARALNLAANDPRQEVFVYGWFLKRVVI